MKHAKGTLAAWAGLLAGTGVSAAAPADWPYPADVAVASSAQPGLAGQRPWDIVRFLKARGPWQANLSPDGRSLAFLSRITGEPQLFVQSLADGSAQQITFGRAVTFHAWAPDSEWLIYGADREGDEREAYTLISKDGLKERRLSESGDAFLSFGAFTWSGDRISYASTERNGTDFDIFARPVAGGEAQLLHQGRFGFHAGPWHPDGARLLVRETRGEDANDLHLLDASAGTLQTLLAPEVASRYEDPVWLHDGAGFYLATDQDREFAGLAFFDLASRALEFLETPDGDIGNVRLFYNERYLAWTVNESGYDRLAVYDRQQEEAVDVPALPPGVYQLSGSSQAALLAIAISGPRTPGEVWLWNLAEERARQAVAPTLAGIDPQTLVEPESLAFAARDGVQLHGLLYRPTDAPHVERAGASGEAADSLQKEELDEQAPAQGGAGAVQGLPLVLMVHGGPTAQARPSFAAVAQCLRGRGYAVFDLNFRGSTGFGKTFARLDNGRLRRNVVRDIEDAVDWLSEAVGIDRNRMAIMGGSYGGYLVNAALGEFPDLFRAGVSFVGVSDWVRALEEASPGLKASDRIEYGDIDNPADRAFFAEISPIAKAHLISAPMLVAHGANDPRDPVSQSDQLVQAVRKQGVEVLYLRFADEGHGLRKLGNRITAYRAVAEFLDEQLAVGKGG